MWRWKVEDAGKFVPEGKTGSVIICNHTSMAEVLPLVTQSGPRQARQAHLQVGIRFDSNRALGVSLRRGGIPVDRGTGDVRMLRAAQHALQRGEDILISLRERACALTTSRSRCTAGSRSSPRWGRLPVPMAVCGFRDITPAGKKLMRPKKCWIRVGDAVTHPDAPGDLKRRDRARWVEDEGRVRRMFALRDQLRYEHPGRF